MNQYFNSNLLLNKEIKYIDYEFRGEKFRFAAHSGVFSKDHVDYATDILLNSIPPLYGCVLDMGCGYGVIGIVLAKTYGLKLTAVDVNPDAVELTRLNCELNAVKADIIESDCFDKLTVNRQPSIVINPPIHAGKSVTYKMYEQSREFLDFGGKLYIVTLKKHGAQSTVAKLRELFKNVQIIYKKKGFFVIESTS
jgi:16S rRNA (guanine1207-N2)-methyltransferase